MPSGELRKLHEVLKERVTQDDINRAAPRDALQWELPLPGVRSDGTIGVRQAKITRFSVSHDWVFVEWVD